jgi:hypothetical protein
MSGRKDGEHVASCAEAGLAGEFRFPDDIAFLYTFVDYLTLAFKLPIEVTIEDQTCALAFPIRDASTQRLTAAIPFEHLFVVVGSSSRRRLESATKVVEQFLAGIPVDDRDRIAGRLSGAMQALVETAGSNECTRCGGGPTVQEHQAYLSPFRDALADILSEFEFVGSPVLTVTEHGPFLNLFAVVQYASPDAEPETRSPRTARLLLTHTQEAVVESFWDHLPPEKRAGILRTFLAHHGTPRHRHGPDVLEMPLAPGSRAIADTVFAKGVLSLVSRLDESSDAREHVAEDAPDYARRLFEDEFYRWLDLSSGRRTREQQQMLCYVPCHVAGVPWIAFFILSEPSQAHRRYQIYRDTFPRLFARVRAAAADAYAKWLAEKLNDELVGHLQESRAFDPTRVNKEWHRLSCCFPFEVPELRAPAETAAPDSVFEAGGQCWEICWQSETNPHFPHRLPGAPNAADGLPETSYGAKQIQSLIARFVSPYVHVLRIGTELRAREEKLQAYLEASHTEIHRLNEIRWRLRGLLEPAGDDEMGAVDEFMEAKNVVEAMYGAHMVRLAMSYNFIEGHPNAYLAKQQFQSQTDVDISSVLGQLRNTYYRDEESGKIWRLQLEGLEAISHARPSILTADPSEKTAQGFRFTPRTEFYTYLLWETLFNAARHGLRRTSGRVRVVVRLEQLIDGAYALRIINPVDWKLPFHDWKYATDAERAGGLRLVGAAARDLALGEVQYRVQSRPQAAVFEVLLKLDRLLPVGTLSLETGHGPD